MANRYDFWIHGVAAVVQDPARVELVEHHGNGTMVEQASETNNWFFFPIPTPTGLDDDTTTFLRRFAVSFKVNENARLDTLEIRRGKDVVFRKAVTFVDMERNHVEDLPDVSTSGGTTGGGITLGVRVAFLNKTPRGRVELYGAGGQFS
jgi:hypothetical protein